MLSIFLQELNLKTPKNDISTDHRMSPPFRSWRDELVKTNNQWSTLARDDANAERGEGVIIQGDISTKKRHFIRRMPSFKIP